MTLRRFLPAIFLSGLQMLICRPVRATTPPLTPGAWTLVHIPDTQNYVASSSLAGYATAQMQWIAANKTARNILFAVQVGDLVNDNSPAQWQRIRTSMNALQGTVPFALATGNHDCGPGGSGSTRATLFSEPEYFGSGSPYSQQAGIAGFYTGGGGTGNTQNSCHRFRAGRVDFLVVTCEWGPRDAVVAWMDEVIAAHPWHRVVIVVHAYLETGSQLFDWESSQSGMNPRAQLPSAGGVNDGRDLWNKVARKHRNVCLVCCGHTGRGYLQSTGDHGHAVHQMLFNTQSSPDGGGGWLRLLEFYPDNRTVRARTYSTLYDEWSTAEADDFHFRLSPVSVTDGDNDLMPDHYEAACGFDAGNAADASTDADHDGATNAEEYTAGTDPHHARDRLAIVECRPGPEGLKWTSVPGKTYRIQRSTSPSSGWTSGTAVTATAWTCSGTLPEPGTQPRSFFRVICSDD